MGIIRDSRSLRGMDITNDGQALVQAESHTESRHHSGKGEAFILTSSFVTHINTADTYTGILWFSNGSDTKQLHVGNLRVSNEVAGKWQVKKGVTALSTPVTKTPNNMSIGSAISFVGTVEGGGATTSVFAGGVIIDQWIQGAVDNKGINWNGAFVLLPGDSLGLEFAPFALASSNEASVSAEVWQSAAE